jgi:hypothetical protein
MANFDLSEPARHADAPTLYACWLETQIERLFGVVAQIPCVASVKRRHKHRALVAISDSFDADEAWHIIRTELEYEAQYVELDDLWDNAFLL